MSRQLAPYEAEIVKVKEKFVPIAGDLVNYDKESVFAMQAIAKTDFAVSVASNNPQSVRLAMINVASTGLTLNPAHAYAYLVPRDGSIVLDISYKGLIKIATDSGAILWARADVVYADDVFAYRGPAAMPEHSADVFKPDRGALVGAYCVAKTRDGDILCEVMPLAEIEKIRGKSDLYKKKQSGPWVEWLVQMCKKAVIKRAAKTWPYTGHSGKLFEAIELANASEGGYTLESDGDVHKTGAMEGMWESMTDAQKEKLRNYVAIIREYFDAEDPKGAADYFARIELDGVEEQSALWSQLSSKIRTGIKTAQATAKQLEHVT